VGERDPNPQPVGVVAVHPPAAPDNGVRRPDRHRVLVDLIEMAHHVGLERDGDGEAF
jgi:hypothetical protein